MKNPEIYEKKLYGILGIFENIFFYGDPPYPNHPLPSNQFLTGAYQDNTLSDRLLSDRVLPTKHPYEISVSASHTSDTGLDTGPVRYRSGLNPSCGSHGQ